MVEAQYEHCTAADTHLQYHCATRRTRSDVASHLRRCDIKMAHATKLYLTGNTGGLLLTTTGDVDGSTGS